METLMQVTVASIENVFIKTYFNQLKGRYCHRIETSQLICVDHLLRGFCLVATLTVNVLIINYYCILQIASFAVKSFLSILKTMRKNIFFVT